MPFMFTTAEAEEGGELNDMPKPAAGKQEKHNFKIRRTVAR